MKKAIEKFKEKFEVIGNYKYDGIGASEYGFSYRLLYPTDSQIEAALREIVAEISELELMKIMEKKL